MKIIIVGLFFALYGVSFGESLSLPWCLEVGLKNNININKAKYEEKLASLRLHADIYRFINVSATATASRDYANDYQMDNANSSLSYSGSLGLHLGFSLEDYYQYESSKIKKHTANFETSSQEQVLIYSITRSFFMVLLKKEDLVLKKEQLKYSQLQYNEAKIKYDHGTLSISELLQSEVSLSQSKMDVANAGYSLENSQIELINLLNIDLRPSDLSLIFMNDKSFDLRLEKDFLIDYAINNNPDYLQIKNNYKMAQIRVSQGTATFYPSLDLNTSTSLSKLKTFDPHSSETDWMDSWKTKLSLSWDLSLSDFNHIDQDRVAAKKSKLYLESKLQDLKKDIVISINELKRLEKEKELISKHLKLAKENLDMANKMFKLGEKTVSDQIKAKNDYINAQYLNVKNKYSNLIELAHLLSIVGKQGY